MKNTSHDMDHPKRELDFLNEHMLGARYQAGPYYSVRMVPEERFPREYNSNPEHQTSVKKYRGVRMRSWGKWVCEIRLPNSRDKVWLGSYSTPEEAARAYDAALVSLRGRSSSLNFPQQPPPIASRCRSTRCLQATAAYAASLPTPSTSTPSIDIHADDYYCNCTSDTLDARFQLMNLAASPTLLEEGFIDDGADAPSSSLPAHHEHNNNDIECAYEHNNFECAYEHNNDSQSYHLAIYFQAQEADLRLDALQHEELSYDLEQHGLVPTSTPVISTYRFDIGDCSHPTSLWPSPN